MTDSLQRMHESIEKYSLLEHPFYRAWDDGKLTSESLRLYAWHYSNFIEKIAEGWRATGDNEIADEEVEHHGLWMDFAKSLGGNPDTTPIEGVEALVKSCEGSFGSYAGALGALYAFEYQQPYTSQSKLKGLQGHYADLGADEVYFDVHKDDFDEPAILRERISKLSVEEQQVAEQACTEVCENLWGALSGIMDRSEMAMA